MNTIGSANSVCASANKIGSAYSTLYPYYQRLPLHTEAESEFAIDFSSPWQQSLNYPIREKAIQSVEKLFLPFVKEKKTERKSLLSQNISLWKIFCETLDPSFSMYPESYQEHHVRFWIEQLKEWMVQPEVKNYLTSRRMYPILQLLDRPTCEWTKHHQRAIGFLWNFLMECSIQIEQERFTQSSDESIEIVIQRNLKGYWYMVKDKK